jgi:hypothetical protein
MTYLGNAMKALGAILGITCLGCAAVCASIAGAIGFATAVIGDAIASAAERAGR